jgi:AcrR family transcriptional regulator
MADVKSRRPYRSERRQEQAQATRVAIMDAARRLFIERGYTATTIEEIARGARVAAITVYSTFGSKPALLAELVSAAVAGLGATRPVYEQERAQELRREPDQRRQIALFTEEMARILARVSPLFEVVDQAAPTAPEIAELRGNMLRGRLHGMGVFVAMLSSREPLRAGLSEEDAAQTVWAVTAPQLFRLLTRDLGWDLTRWSQWAADTLTAALLPA